MEGHNSTHLSTFVKGWRFLLGQSEAGMTEIDTPGRWEDLLFTFARNDKTATVQEDMSFTLTFVGNGARMLRERVTGMTDIDNLRLRVQKWDYKKGAWETYYEGTIDDGSIRVHAHYCEAGTAPLDVGQVLIDKAEEEYDVPVAGSRVVVPRMWPAGALAVANKPGTYGLAYSVLPPSPDYNLYQISYKLGRTGSSLSYGATIGDGVLVANPYWAQSVLDPKQVIIAKPGRYRITNRSTYSVQMWWALTPDGPLVPAAGLEYLNMPVAGNTDIRADGTIYGRSAKVLVNGQWIAQGDTFDGLLAKGDTVSLYAGGYEGQGVDGFIVAARSNNPAETKTTYRNEARVTFTGSVTIEPVLDTATVPPVSAPAVPDTEVFAALVRRATGRPSLTVDVSRYRPVPYTNASHGLFLLDLSRLKDNETVDGASVVQGSAEANFQGLTLSMFYRHFRAQGYAVAVEKEQDREGKWYPVVRVARMCYGTGTGKEDEYFYPWWRGDGTDPLIADLGDAVTDVSVVRYPNTFSRVVVGSEPRDYGNFPREEGYQDPTNRRITYGLGKDDKREPYVIGFPWEISTFGLESEILAFESEDDEARARRWTEGGRPWLVTASKDADGRIASIVQYDPLPGLYYKPINLGLRPESLVRYSIPWLAMSLGAFDMETTFYEVVDIEGDAFPVTADGGRTGDVWLREGFTTDAAITETYSTRDPDPGGAEATGVFFPVVVELRSTTSDNVFVRLRDAVTRYGFVRFLHEGKPVVGYLRGVEINPTEQAVQRWEIFPVWFQDMKFLASNLRR